MSATLNDFRQIAASSYSYFCGSNARPGGDGCSWEFGVSLIPLYKRSYKIFNLSASGGYRVNETNIIVNSIATPKTYGGQFHFGFLTDLAVLSSIFGPAIDPGAYALNAIQIAFPPNNQNTVTSAANLVQQDARLLVNDLQKTTQQVILGAQAVSQNSQQALFDSLNNQRTLFSLPFGYFGPTESQFQGALSAQTDPAFFPQNYIVPPGFDYLVLFPFSGISLYSFGAGPNLGHYANTFGFDLSSTLNFNMLPISAEDFDRIIPVS